MDQFTCKIKDHENLPIRYLCLQPECPSQYNCQQCSELKHKDHTSQLVLIADISRGIDSQIQINDQIRKKIQVSIDDLQNEFNQLLKRLEQKVMNLLNFVQKPLSKLNQQQHLSFEEIYLFRDITRENYNQEQYDVICQQIQDIKCQIISWFQEIIKPLEEGNLDLNLPDFVFTTDLVYRDIKIIDPKTIEDKIVLSMSLHLGQALVFPPLQECNQGIVKIRFHIIKVGMSVQIGLGVDLEHTLYCSINQKGETYSIFDNAAHNRKCDFQFQSQDIIQCIFDKNKLTLTVKNEKTDDTYVFKNIQSKQPLYFFLQILFAKVAIIN